MSARKYKFVQNALSGTYMLEEEFEKLFPGHQPRARPSERRTGLIYLLAHESGRMVKVGMTTVSASSRKTAYTRAQRLLGEWTVVNSWQINEPSRAEKAIHRKLKQFRFSGRATEVFACSIQEALSIIEEVLRAR